MADNLSFWLNGAPVIVAGETGDFANWIDGAPDVGISVIVITAAAALAGVSSLSAPPHVDQFGAAALIGAGALSGNSSVEQFGAAALAGVGALAGVAEVKEFGASALAGVGTLSGVAKVEEFEFAAVVGASALVGHAVVREFGHAALAGVGELSESAMVRSAAAGPEVDIRLYSADGKRKSLPQGWITTASFEIGERGGCLTGSLEVDAPWEQLAIDGTEYVDIRLWGEVLYRGYVRTPQQELATPERATLNTIGLMELLNGFLIPRDFCYGTPQNIDVLFRDIITFYATPNLPGGAVQISTAGVVGTGILVQQMSLSGKTVSQAFNAICDAAPGQLIWGADVDSLGRNRLYLHPRTQAIGYRFSVGGEVTAFVYPRDATQVVNRVHVTGAKADPALGYPPNLMPDASFEDCVLPGELTSNVLLNPSFDLDNGGTRPGAGWQAQGDPSIDGTYARSSPNAAVFDDNPSAPEGSYQDIAVSGGAPVNASFWGMTIAGETWDFEFILQYFDVANTLLDSVTLTGTPAADNVYRHYQLTWANPVAATATYLRYVIRTTGGSGAHGLNVDDCSMWFPGVLNAGSWEAAGGLNGNFHSVDFANAGTPGVIAPYDGGLMVKALPNIFGAGATPYSEIRVTLADRPAIKSNLAYMLTAHVRVLGVDADIKVGANLYIDDALDFTSVSSATTIHAADGWVDLQFGLTAGGLSNKIQPFVRFETNNVEVYVDAVGLYEGNAEPDLYYPGDTIMAARSVSDYSGSVSAAANASLATWGLREVPVSQDTITTKALLDAYCPSYFDAFAVANVQARLEIDGAVRAINLDGTVKLLNLPSPPPALFPSKVRYDVGETIKVSADLNNERPDLAILLMRIALGQPSGV